MKTLNDAEWDAEVRDQTENGIYRELLPNTVVKWADAMEAKMADGAELLDIAYPTLIEVDDTISGGGVYECVRLLLKHWEHHEELMQVVSTPDWDRRS